MKLVLLVLLFIFVGCASTPQNVEPKDGECKFIKRNDRVPAFTDTQHRYIKCFDEEAGGWVEYNIKPIDRSPTELDQPILIDTKKPRKRAPASF
jgi:hypothetical protein